MDDKVLPSAEEVLASPFRFVVGSEAGGQRLDLYLAGRPGLADLSRSRLKQLIQAGMVLVGGARQKAGYLVRAGDTILVGVPEPVASELVAEPVGFAVLHEDDDLIVLVKPPGLVVHPACGHSGGTLVHGLLYHCGSLSGINGELRPGIVHRLDKDTSGVMVAAKTDRAHHGLSRQFKDREVEKIYLALVEGLPSAASGRVDRPIGRHRVHRKKMAVCEDGREAASNWRVLDRFPAGFALLEVRLETGRTHQIRVHMAFLGHPLAGDPLYGRKNPEYERMGIIRLCLHAHRLAFRHPRSGERLSFIAPLWPDMDAVLERLRHSCDRLP